MEITECRELAGEYTVAKWLRLWFELYARPKSGPP